MWYSAKLLYESHVDDDQRIGPLCEESIILVEADDEKSAEAKAVKHGQEGEHSYENPDGNMVVWRFVKVLETQDLCEEKLYPGVEVYSRLYRKNLGDDDPVAED